MSWVYILSKMYGGLELPPMLKHGGQCISHDFPCYRRSLPTTQNDPNQKAETEIKMTGIA